MPKEADERDLLVDFEIKNLPDEYREYYKIKRNNFFASIQTYPELWTFFCRLDEIWKRDLMDLEVGIRAETAFPLMLYINAHSKMRISVELAFSMCLQESRSVLRDAVESVAHAHHMLRDPANLRVWLEKDDPDGDAAFKRVFQANKATNLFKGLDELHEKFGELSEAGSHPTLQSFYNKVTIRTTASSKGMVLSYTGAEDARGFALELFSRLLTCFVMERTLFDDYELRLKLDPQLMRMRQEFEAYTEHLRQHMIKKYDVKPPGKKPGKP